MTTELRTLVGKLNAVCRTATESAANLTLRQGHYQVEVEHLFLVLLEQAEADFALLARQFGVSQERLDADLRRQLTALETGNCRTPVFSLQMSELLEQAWLIASLESPLAQIRSGHLLHALLVGHGLRQIAERASSEFRKIDSRQIGHALADLTRSSIESPHRHAESTPGLAPEHTDETERLSKAQTGLTALKQYTIDLTKEAENNRIDPVIGREPEIRQLIDVLSRRRQNNPILTGEAGVGKTAVVEGLALRIATGDVPELLQGARLHMLDMGLLQAGASVKGEFESRLKNVIREITESEQLILLFIDEAHGIIGAGGQPGQGDAANLLKPALARGALRTIAATTWSEYKRYFEKDAALARRFQVVAVDEPNELIAADMLRGMLPVLESHFGVRILDEAVTEAVRLSNRYISGRQLPDKAVSVLDTACARVAIAQNTVPASIDDQSHRLQRLKTNIAAIQRETLTDPSQESTLKKLILEQTDANSNLAKLQDSAEAQTRQVQEILKLREIVESAANGNQASEMESDAGKAACLHSLNSATNELARLQSETALIPLQVDAQAIAEVVSAWSGVPLGRMLTDEIDCVLTLETQLEQRVIGQPHALKTIADKLRTARASLEDPQKPQAVFLFTGPSGVGKTESALALAATLYGGEHKLITINMSEYQEAHSVASLKGSPPGYVAYGEGGVLTEAVRRNPYSVILLDEIEKAHPDVLELFYQVFDKGRLEDAEGRVVNFRNCVLVLTSNVASAEIVQSCVNRPAEEWPDATKLYERIRPVLYKHFKPAFLGRLTVVPYYPVSEQTLERIIRLKLEAVGTRLWNNQGAALKYTDNVVEAILTSCVEIDTGARNADHIISNSLLPNLSRRLLTNVAEGKRTTAVRVKLNKSGIFDYRFTTETVRE